MSMWEPFTERARRSIVLAQEEAQRLGNNYIGTEHILLGIISEGESLAAKVLETLGVNLAKVRQEVEAIVGRGGQTVQQEMVFTPRAKRVIELAFEEARQLNHNYIGTEHLLLGLIREGEGVAARVLTNLGRRPGQGARADDLAARRRGPAARAQGQVARRRRSTRTAATSRTLARENKLDPVIGRANEIERVIQILSRRTKNNPALIGEPGVGKTAIAEGLAQRVIKSEVPEPLRDKRVITLDLAGLVAGTKYRGEFEERMKRVMDEIRGAAGEIILFIDELHTLVGAGAAEGAIDARNIIKPALARGELQCIGATTLNEFRKHIEKDSALERRFQPVMVGEPTVDETVEILKGLRDRYEAHHKVTITDEALVAAAKLGDRYITDRFLPDKAVDLIDEAASRVRLQATLPPPEIREIENQIRQVKQEKESVVKSQEFEKAAAIRDREEKLRLEKQRLEAGVGRQARRAGQDPQGHRGRHRPHRRVVDEDPGVAARAGRDGQAARHGGPAPQARDRPEPGDLDADARDPPFARRAQEPEAPDRLVHLPRPDRRRQDRSRALARRVHVRRRRVDDPHRHVGVHGEVRGLAAGRRTSRIRRLRRGRPAHRSGAPPSVLGRAARRDREGASRRVQPAAAGARRRAADRLSGPRRRLQEHRHHHDVQRRRDRHDDDDRHRLPHAEGSRRPTIKRTRR